MTVMCPASGRVRPAMQFSNVVLPLPDGPNTEVTPRLERHVAVQRELRKSLGHGDMGNRRANGGHTASWREVFASSQLWTTRVATAMAMAMEVSRRAVESSRRMTAE